MAKVIKKLSKPVVAETTVVPEKVEAPPVEVTTELIATFIRNKRIEVTVGRTVNLGDFNSAKLQVTISEFIPEDAEDAVYYEKLWDEASAQIDEQIAQYEDEEEEEEEEEDEVIPEKKAPAPAPEKKAPAPEPEEEEEEDLTEDDINKMSKAELIELCQETEGLEDVDTSVSVKVLRATLIDMLFEEEGEDGEVTEEEGEDGEVTEGEGGEWEDEDWQDEK